MRLLIDDVTVSRGGAAVVRGVTLDVPAGRILGLVGPNGSGKSTLLRTVYRAARPDAGRIVVGDEDLHAMSPRAAGLRVAALTQENPSEFDMRVLETVLLGRTPHHRGFGGDTADDLDIAVAAVERVGARHLMDRSFRSLSGGEKQRVLLARAIAQQSQVLVLDEPTNHLDIAHQLEVMAIVAELGLTTVVALHDLDLAARHCHEVAILAGGGLVAAGAPADVLTTDRLREVFAVESVRVTNPVTGQHHLLIAGPAGHR